MYKTDGVTIYFILERQFEDSDDFVYRTASKFSVQLGDVRLLQEYPVDRYELYPEDTYFHFKEYSLKYPSLLTAKDFSPKTHFWNGTNLEELCDSSIFNVLSKDAVAIVFESTDTSDLVVRVSKCMPVFLISSKLGKFSMSSSNGVTTVTLPDHKIIETLGPGIFDRTFTSKSCWETTYF